MITAGLVVFAACVSIAMHNGIPAASIADYTGPNYVEALPADALPQVKQVLDSTMIPNVQGFIDLYDENRICPNVCYRIQQPGGYVIAVEGFVSITYARPTGRVMQVDPAAMEKYESFVKQLDKVPVNTDAMWKLRLDYEINHAMPMASPAAKPDATEPQGPRRYKPTPGNGGPMYVPKTKRPESPCPPVCSEMLAVK